MISFDTGAHRFDYRAAVVLLKDDAVLLHRTEGDEFWSLPGGRVEAGESAEQAAVREMQEELSEPIKCERLVFVVENFFSHAQTKHHEVGLYFNAYTIKNSKLCNTEGPYIGTEGHRKLEFAWFKRASLSGIDVRPSFLVEALACNELTFKHVVHREQNAV